MEVLLVFNELNSASNMSISSLLIDDVKALVMSFAHATFLFVKSSVNMVAHLLAREALSMPDLREWYFTPQIVFHMFLFWILMSNVLSL